MTPFNAFVQALIDMLEEMSGPHKSPTMVNRIQLLIMAVNKVEAEEVKYLIEQLHRLKDGA